MGLSGKLVSHTSIKNGDVFFEVLRYRPNDFSRTTPQFIQGVDLCSGQWGEVGSLTRWNFTKDGTRMVSDEIIEAIDEGKKTITYKAIEGDLVKLYKNLKYHISVDTTGEDNLVTWTLEYEKSEDVPDPTTLMDLCLLITKDAERLNSYMVPN